ncbi:MAG: UMP kinase [Bacteroidales bacterium]|nr:UMP kinase [Bacteroidales bacterium]
MRYKRVLLKLSGEALMGNNSFGIDNNIVNTYLQEIIPLVKEGLQIAIVIGGGNIYRGLKGADNDGIDRTQADYMGMMATLINSLFLQSAFEKKNIKTKLLSGLAVEGICDKMTASKAIENLEKGKVVIIGGGTGNPFFTTDTAAALRAVEIKADAILKGTRVDGIYDSDPEKNKSAVKYDKITYNEAYNKKLMIMDLTAFTLCSENKLPIIVFNMNAKDNLRKIITGENIGTIVQE